MLIRLQVAAGQAALGDERVQRLQHIRCMHTGCLAAGGGRGRAAQCAATGCQAAQHFPYILLIKTLFLIKTLKTNKKTEKIL
jgi:hypothetical protein